MNNKFCRIHGFRISGLAQQPCALFIQDNEATGISNFLKMTRGKFLILVSFSLNFVQNLNIAKGQEDCPPSIPSGQMAEGQFLESILNIGNARICSTRCEGNANCTAFTLTSEFGTCDLYIHTGFRPNPNTQAYQVKETVVPTTTGATPTSTTQTTTTQEPWGCPPEGIYFLPDRGWSVLSVQVVGLEYFLIKEWLLQMTAENITCA